jgi:hypothetical protein
MQKSTVHTAITSFVKGISMNPEYAKDLTSRARFAKANSSPSAKIQFSRLEKIYTFGIKKKDYQVEAIAIWYPQQDVPLWGLTVRHKEWPMLFDGQESLRPGSGADWSEDVVGDFFPNNGYERNGVSSLFSDLMELSKVIKPPPAKRVPTLGAGLYNPRLLDLNY